LVRFSALPLALVALIALAGGGIASCKACGDESTTPAVDDANSHAGDANRGEAPRTLATLHEPVDALAAGRGVLFGIDRAHGVVFAVADEGDAAGNVREISHAEVEPFALVVRAGEPVWASHDGIFTSNEDGGQRRAIVASTTVRALGSGPHDIVFADDRGISRVEWPAAAKAIVLVPDVHADEVLATVETIVWLERGPGTVGLYDLKSRAKKQIASGQRKPHDLEVAGDERTVTWHEGEAVEAQASRPRAFLADTVTGTVRELPGAWEPSASYVVQGPCVVGPGVCKGVASVDWTILSPGPKTGRVVVGSSRVSWVEGMGEGVWRIVSTPLSTCCR
jgi:hypothetical protein